MNTVCVSLKIKSPGMYIFSPHLLQTLLAPISQVFPAEDDVNKHVEDNCKLMISVMMNGETVINL